MSTMSLPICGTAAVQFNLDFSHPTLAQISSCLPPRPASSAGPIPVNIWTMMQTQNPTRPPSPPAATVRRSTFRMNEKSLEMCTESLGSETGSSDFYDQEWFSMSTLSVAKEKTGPQEDITEVINGSHHRSSNRSPPRSFPPPLPSISSRDRPCIHMKSHRRDGRLVLEAVPVATQNFLCAQRLGGRLLLSFVDTYVRNSESSDTMQLKGPEDVNNGDAVKYEDEDEEEVEVVDKGTVVEVKVSTQTHLPSGTKVIRSSIVINKFVGGAPLGNESWWANLPALSPKCRMPPATTTAAVAAVAASSVSASMEVAGHSMSATKTKLLFKSKRRNREEMLHNMQRCRELQRPLFFWEPCWIAAAS